MDVLFSAAEIANRVGTLAAEIANAVPPSARSEGLVLVGPLKGCLMFQSDLMRALHAHLPWLEADFLGLSSYGAGTESSGTVALLSDLRHPVRNRHLLLVDDIVDTGRTLAFAQAHLQAKGPASLRTATLLDKPSRRIVPVPVEHVGFVIEDVFVLGYGTDLAERYRELPDIVLHGT
jgi:hypoxanthine phosphoribosyltransferase